MRCVVFLGVGCVLALACSSPDDSLSRQEAPRHVPLAAVTSAEGPVKPPSLDNRDEVIRYRNEAARMLLPAGDSLLVTVYARIDEQGVPHQPEVRGDVTDARVVGAAISVVQKMHFAPAHADGRPKSVLIKIPVKFVHPPAP